MYDFHAKVFQRALREQSNSLIVGVLIQFPVLVILLGTLICVLLIPFGVSLVESLPHFMGAVVEPLALVQTHLILSVSFVIYLCFVSYRNWTVLHTPYSASWLYSKILKSKTFWISISPDNAKLLYSPDMTSAWFAYPERAAIQGTRYLPGDSPQLE